MNHELDGNSMMLTIYAVANIISYKRTYCRRASDKPSAILGWYTMQMQEKARQGSRKAIPVPEYMGR